MVAKFSNFVVMSDLHANVIGEWREFSSSRRVNPVPITSIVCQTCKLKKKEKEKKREESVYGEEERKKRRLSLCFRCKLN